MRLAITLFTVVCLVGGLVIVVATGSVATQLGKTLGVGSSAVTVREVVKWPILLVIFMLLLAVLYAAGHGGDITALGG